MNDQFSKLYINSQNILEKLFEQRQEEIYDITNNKKNLIAKQSKDYSNVYIAIDNIPNTFKMTRENIKLNMEKYLETLNDNQAYENEEFYKEGFSDAINLIMNCINKNYTQKKEL